MVISYINFKTPPPLKTIIFFNSMLLCGLGYKTNLTLLGFIFVNTILYTLDVNYMCKYIFFMESTQ
jgi:hypothetical protein